MPLDYDLENDLALRKLKEAAALRGSPMASPTIRVGGRDIVNWLGPVNRLMEQTQGNRMEDDTTARLRDLSQQQLGEVDAYNKAVATPGSKLLRQEGPTVDGGNIPDQQIPLSPEEENQRQMALSLDATRLPKARAMAEKFVQSGVGFPEKQAQLKVQQDLLREQQAARIAAQQQQAAMLEEGRNQRASDANALRMTLASIAASNRAARMGGSGSSDGLSPSQQKRQDAMDKTEESKTRSGALLDEMETNIDILDRNKGITNTERSPLSNALSWAQNTGIGQVGGKIAGTTNQKARNNIESLATNLVLELKNAKGLSASQMNSNMELQRYLTAVAGGNNYDAGSMKDVVRRARTLIGSPSAQAGTAPAPTASNESAPSEMVRVSSPEEAAALPPGTKYVRPDGKVGVKK